MGPVQTIAIYAIEMHRDSAELKDFPKACH